MTRAQISEEKHMSGFDPKIKSKKVVTLTSAAVGLVENAFMNFLTGHQ